MRKLSLILLAMIFGFANAASAAEIADLAWNEANIKTLRAMDKAAYYRFYGRQEDPNNEMEWSEDNLGLDYDWYPAGNGTYEMAINSQSGPDVAYLDIYWRDAGGKITSQSMEIVGDASEDWYNGPQFADLNHDGSYELILFAPLEYDWPGPRTNFIPDGDWPQVYRLRNGKYAEASRDFPAFYTKQILPQLDAAIAKTQAELHEIPPGKASSSWGPDDSWHTQLARRLAALIMARDKIRRFLGIDRDAGIVQARGWMKSPDPVIVDDAVSVFRDIGGHEADVQAARVARENASKRWPYRVW